mgnify:CR=1 FL=1
MDHPGAQHAHGLLDQVGVQLPRLGGLQIHVHQSGGGLALTVRDQLHHQHTLDKVVGHWHTNPCSLQAVDIVYLRSTPRGLNLFFTVL